MFWPWGSVALLVLAVGLMALQIRDVRRRRRRGGKGWAKSSVVVGVAMLLIVSGQVFTLVDHG